MVIKQEFINNIKKLKLNKTNFRGSLKKDSLKLYRKTIDLSKKKDSVPLELLLNLYEISTLFGAGNEVNFHRHQDFTYNPPISRLIEILNAESGVRLNTDVYFCTCIYCVYRHKGQSTDIGHNNLDLFDQSLKELQDSKIITCLDLVKNNNLDNKLLRTVYEASFLDYLRHLHIEWGDKLNYVPMDIIQMNLDHCNKFLKSYNGPLKGKIIMWKNRAEKILDL